MKPSEIRDMGIDEAKAKCADLEGELFNFKIQNSMGQLDNPVKLRYIKRDIARIKTIIAEKGKEG